MSALSRFKNNALGWLDSYIKDSTEMNPKLKSHMRSADHYFGKCEDLELKFVARNDFHAILGIFPEDLVGFDGAQAAEIDWFVNEYLMGVQECVYFLQLWARAYSSFLDSQEDPIPKTIVDAYTYFRTKAFERFPELKAHYLKMKGRIKEKANRPKCSCGGSVMSQGASWKCSTCGRSFSKVYKKDRDSSKSQRPASIRKDGRPACPSCGGYKVVSSGANWRCKICGRQFAKTGRWNKK